jgi:hypothetical protein
LESDVIEVHPVQVTKQKLASMPQEERTFLLLLGNAANEINVLTKLVVLAGNAKETGQFVDYVHSHQTLILLRLLIGKLHETWKLFRTNFLSNKGIATKYRAQLGDDANAAIDYLKRHFESSPLTDIRDASAFHAPTAEEIEKAFQALPESELWYFYLADQGLSFYFASELVVAKVMLSKVPVPSHNGTRSPDEVAFSELCRIVIKVSENMGLVLDRCIAEVAVPYSEAAESVQVCETVTFSEVSLPFYVEGLFGA